MRLRVSEVVCIGTSEIDFERGLINPKRFKEHFAAITHRVAAAYAPHPAPSRDANDNCSLVNPVSENG